MRYPLRLGLRARRNIAMWRPFVHWLLAIPQLLITYALRTLRQALLIISFFSVLFTGRIPRGLFDTIVMTFRYRWRVVSYLIWMRESYPPFDFTPSAADVGGDPAFVSVRYPRRLNQWLPLVKWFLAIPHFVVLVFLKVGAVFAIILSIFGVLATGQYPEGIGRYIVGVTRWSLRVEAYVFFLRDEYPPFRLSP
ncbi:MAG: DUF4389 domain-containing protein [Actinomycetota bacterium]